MLLISEIFGPVIQGEGPVSGYQTVFVRTGGCDFRCSWCDSLHAVLPENKQNWTRMDDQQVLQRVEQLSNGQPIMVTFSGGNPALMPLGDLIKTMQERGHTICVETQGSRCPEWFKDVDVLVLSPKPPSSGMSLDVETLRRCIEIVPAHNELALKIVVGDEQDFQFALSVHSEFPDVPFYVQPLNETPGGAVSTQGLMEKLEWLMERTLAERDTAIIVRPQLHVMVYGNERCK